MFGLLSTAKSDTCAQSQGGPWRLLSVTQQLLTPQKNSGLWRDIIGVKVLALHLADPVLVLSMVYAKHCQGSLLSTEPGIALNISRCHQKLSSDPQKPKALHIVSICITALDTFLDL